MRVSPKRRERGSSVVEFVLVLLVFMPLVLGIVQVGLVLWVRNAMTTAASDAARAAAPLGASEVDAHAKARAVIGDALNDDWVDSVEVTSYDDAGTTIVEVRVVARVPPLGLGYAGVPLEAKGHAVRQVAP